MANISWLGGAGNATQQVDVGNATNYSGAAVPTTGDNLFVAANPAGTDFSMAGNLTALSGVTLASLTVYKSYSGQIGTTAAYLQVSATTVNLGLQFGGTSNFNGSNLIRLNLGSVASTVNVIASNTSSALSTAGPICLLGTNASNVLDITGGIVTCALTPGETSTFATINCAGNLTLGAGVTLTTVNLNGGSIYVQSAVTTLTVNSGSLITYGAGAITTVNLYSGTGSFRSTGTITNLNVYNATANFSSDPQAKTVTNTTLYSGANLNVNNGVKGSVTFTNPIATKASAGQFTITAWPNSSFALS